MEAREEGITEGDTGNAELRERSPQFVDYKCEVAELVQLEELEPG